MTASGGIPKMTCKRGCTVGKRLCAMLLLLSLLLSGCSVWMNEPFVSVTPHVEEYVQSDSAVAETAGSYDELYALLLKLIEAGTTQATVDVSEYTGNLELGLRRILYRVRREDPLAAYTVTDIVSQIAEVGVRHIVTIDISYIEDLDLFRQRKQAWGADGVKSRVETALKMAESRLLLEVNGYQEMDLQALVRQYYMEHPDEVMELPQVTVAVYPDRGNKRIMQIDFAYTHDRQTLLAMADEVQTMLTSASLYIRGQETQLARAERLSAFLRPMLTQEGTSVTPVYSLFHHGIADSHALAHIFWLLCQKNGLECRVVTGSKAGKDYCWNILSLDGATCHVDLMDSWLESDLVPRFDDEMDAYTWDTTLYPSCDRPETPPETQPEDTEPVREQTPPEEDTAPTEPEQTQPETQPETQSPSEETLP